MYDAPDIERIENALQKAARKYEEAHPEIKSDAVQVAEDANGKIMHVLVNPSPQQEKLSQSMENVSVKQQSLAAFASQLWQYGNLGSNPLAMSMDAWSKVSTVAHDITESAGLELPSYGHPFPTRSPKEVLTNPTDLPISLAMERLEALSASPNPLNQQSVLENLEIMMAKGHRQALNEDVFSQESLQASWSEAQKQTDGAANLIIQALEMQVAHDHPDTPKAAQPTMACAIDQTQLMAEHKLQMHALSRTDTYAWAHSIIHEPEKCRLIPPGTDKAHTDTQPILSEREAEQVQRTLNNARQKSAQFTGKPAQEEGIIASLKRDNDIREVKAIARLREQCKDPETRDDIDPAVRLLVSREQTLSAAVTRFGKTLGVVRPNFDGYQKPLTGSTMQKLLKTNEDTLKENRGSVQRLRQERDVQAAETAALSQENDALKSRLDNIADLVERMGNTPEAQELKALLEPSSVSGLTDALDDDPFIGEGPKP